MWPYRCHDRSSIHGVLDTDPDIGSIHTTKILSFRILLPWIGKTLTVEILWGFLLAFGKGINGPTKAEPCVSKNFGNTADRPKSRKARVTAIFDTLIYSNLLYNSH